jgi:hypothetical protein
LKAEYATMKQELLAALENVLEHQHFIMGPEVSKLETEVAALIGCGFALGCASGSDARHPKCSNAKFLSEQNGLVLEDQWKLGEANTRDNSRPSPPLRALSSVPESRAGTSSMQS